MRSIIVVSACLLALAAGAAHGQYSRGSHHHAGPGSSSPCDAGRFDGSIKNFKESGEAGKLSHKVSTNNTPAQQFFDQGLTFFYGFDSESAMRSFHQASREDPGLAMAYWGVALAAGGDLNIPTTKPCMKLAREQIRLAFDRRAQASPAERLYVEALAKRYAVPGPEPVLPDHHQLAVDYALAMKTVYQDLRIREPKDADAGALYAYSLMNLRPWLWWTAAGQPAVEVAEVLKVVETGLPAFPDHIGLHHLHVHAMEEGPIAAAVRAKASADFLHRNAPPITPHLRHMPAHIYLLMGDWQGVIDANQAAVDADRSWVEKCGSVTAPLCNQLLVGHYYSHDLLFLAVGHNNRGDLAKVLELSDQLEKNARRFLADQPGLEHYITTKVMMLVHFAQWQLLADLPPPQSSMPGLDSKEYCNGLEHKLAAALWYFGRAMGRASLGQPAGDDLRGFQQAQACVQDAGLGWGNNAASDVLKVVHWRLLERIARMERRPDASRMFALLAVESEDLLGYDEPPGWYVSSRETYGAALYLQKAFGEAEKVFREDQARRPNNTRSLFGLWQALKEQGPSKAEEARQWEERFQQHWKGAPLKMEDL
ncbi:MAG TPA: hypothetical protein VEG34_10735 [Thermoanaerobaculia bacterium]|nr:hypothetical protein [Thermoanaerobaculia bacterium]